MVEGKLWEVTNTERILPGDIRIFLTEDPAYAYKQLMESAGKKGLTVDYREGIDIFKAQNEINLQGGKWNHAEVEKWFEDFLREDRQEFTGGADRGAQALEGAVGPGLRRIGVGGTKALSRGKRNLPELEQKQIDVAEKVFDSWGIPAENRIYVQVDRDTIRSEPFSAANILVKNPATGERETYYVINFSTL